MPRVSKRSGQIQPDKIDRGSIPSFQSSMTSLSPSQLNFAVSAMLGANAPKSGCEIVCRGAKGGTRDRLAWFIGLLAGDPITASGQRNQTIRMLAVILIPITILVGLTGNSFGIAIKSYLDSNSVRETLYFSIDLGAAIRMLQRERDMSALYLSTIKPETKGFLLQSYIDTDETVQNLTKWPVAPSNTMDEFKSSENFLKTLNRHRYELDTMNHTFKDELILYTFWIEEFIRWFYESITEAKTDKLWRAFVAYQELILASEYLGRERAAGVIFYIQGQFPSRSDYLYFLQAQNAGNASFESARQYSPRAREIYDKSLVQNENFLLKIQEKRNEIRANNQKGKVIKGDLDSAKWWFENMTYFQDVIRDAQIALALEIDDLLTERQGADLSSIIIITIIFISILTLCPIITCAVYNLTKEIQKTSIHIADRTKALSKEKKRTDTLLYQMLPKSVADRLKQGEEIPAEEFKTSTLMFADVVGFTQISDRSSPLQIVEMMNMLFSCLDERIEAYDVYKVETIGDAYLVASGVPKPNGNRHASEIALLSLDILRHTNNMEIPHIPGTNIRLRIGCHSGPVVAGVVGSKMPHYCIFGETVNIASKMESFGKACHIHVSKTTAEILIEVGGFVLKERGKFEGKDDHDLMMAFRGNPVTYWLVCKKGEPVMTPGCTPSSSMESLN